MWILPHLGVSSNGVDVHVRGRLFGDTVPTQLAFLFAVVRDGQRRRGVQPQGLPDDAVQKGQRVAVGGFYQPVPPNSGVQFCLRLVQGGRVAEELGYAPLHGRGHAVAASHYQWEPGDRVGTTLDIISVEWKAAKRSTNTNNIIGMQPLPIWGTRHDSIRKGSQGVERNSL